MDNSHFFLLDSPYFINIQKEPAMISYTDNSCI